MSIQITQFLNHGHTPKVDITVDTATIKHFHQEKAEWTELLQNGDNQEAEVQRRRHCCASLPSGRACEAFSLKYLHLG